jgi:hypothetical protein
LGVTSRIVGSPSRANGLVSLSALAEHEYRGLSFCAQPD